MATGVESDIGTSSVIAARDGMDRLAFHNDRIIDASEIAVHPAMTGVLYGWGVFTTVRVYERHPFAVDRHIARLVDHARRAEIGMPIEPQAIGRAVGALIEANEVVHGRARLTILKGGPNAWRSAGDPVDFFIFTSSEPPGRTRSFALTASRVRVLATGPLAGVKRTSMLEHLLALDEARSRGFSEALLFNERGEIVSAAAANIFWSDGEEIFTPSLGTGCVPGITRAMICETARRIGMPLVEGAFPAQRLLEASEAFLTSTGREVAPVSRFDFREYKSTDARFTPLLMREFQKLLGSDKIGP